MAAFRTRGVVKTILSVEQSEGMGARVRRSIGRPELKNFDPFLMLDEFKVAVPAGFPDHPHRGFETVTYLLPTSEGTFRHEDFNGHQAQLSPGDLQWMTAGKGIVHAEMPVNEKIAHGLQLWVNLASKDKGVEPAYQELSKKDIPVAESEGVKAVVIAGEALGVKSPVYTRTPTHYLHFTMEPNSTLEQPIPEEWNAFAYVLQGGADFGGSQVTAHHTVVLDRKGVGIAVSTKDTKVDFVLVAGQPIGEPVKQYGPFVVNTDEEIHKAFHDYQSASGGFEKAKGWRSEIAH